MRKKHLVCLCHPFPPYPTTATPSRSADRRRCRGGRQVVCELYSCPAGLESVVVGDEDSTRASSGRTLLLGAHHLQRQRRVRQSDDDPHWAVRGRNGESQRGQDRAPRSGGGNRGSDWVPGLQKGPGGRRRRLTSIEDVVFLMPYESGAEGEDGQVMTESQQAAAFVNNMANPVSSRWV